MLGATGAMYAIRKELFSELPQDLILDDVYIPLKAIEKGFRAIFEPKAKIYDTAVKNAREEFLRKTRTLAGNFQIFVYLKRLFNPFKSPIAWQLFSHKFLRLIVPFLLVIAFISNALILDNYFYKITFALQIFFYSLAFLGLIFKRVSRTLNIPYMFCVMNCAAVVGLYRFLNHKQDVLWEKGNHEKI
jgi:cellulose synthase/poly-beta-1,6-N-acetylglucosamine synthase-like glycosyltransferase